LNRETYEQVVERLLNTEDEKVKNIIQVKGSDQYYIDRARGLENFVGVVLPADWIGKRIVCICEDDLDNESYNTLLENTELTKKEKIVKKHKK
jgi:hypothetical protein